MAHLRTWFAFVCYLKVIIIMDNLAGKIDALELDYALTRKEVITFVGQAANLACYTTNTNAPMTYSWTKDNRIVNQSSNVRIFDNVMVITPMRDADFGNYMCNISNGASSASCRISLSKGINNTEYEGHPTKEPKTGCVNISVLMPVLAVAVMSLLLFIHLLVRGKRAQDNLRDGKMKHSEECSSRHSEASTSVIEEPIELQANGYVSSAHHTNGHVPRTPMNGRALSHSPGFKHSSRALVSENVTSSPVFTRMSRFHVNGQESQSPVNRLSSPRSDNELSSQTQMGDAQRQEVTPF